MKSQRPFQLLAAWVFTAFMTAASSAAVHLMQVEQIIGGVNGDATRQAVQLRMRGPGQIFLSFARVRAFDAAGQNPVMIIDMSQDVAIGTTGSRILIASPNFATSPSVSPDFVMTNLIPPSYLSAGSLTFENDGGEILWRVCWGGAGYTGATDVALFNNDDDGSVAPPFAGPLPNGSLQALRFTGTATAGSTTNAAQYAVTAGAAVFVNNTGNSGTVIEPPPPPSCPGNVNGDSTVNVTDLLAVIGAWGPCDSCPDIPCPPDVAPPKRDCEVNVTDLLQVIGGWGACP